MARSRPRRRPTRRSHRSSARSTRRSALGYGGLAVAVFGFLWLRERPAVAIGIGVAVLLVGLTAGALFLAGVRMRRQREVALTRSVARTDGLTGPDFERWLATLLRRTGFTDVLVHGGANDLGADVSARTPGGWRLVVQCKRYRVGRKVGSPEVQRFAGTASRVHEADIAAIVTTAHFTQQARDLAPRVDIRLIDRELLARWATDGVPPVALARPLTGAEELAGPARWGE